MKNPIPKVSRGGTYKTEIQAEIVQIFQEVEFINQYFGKNIATFKRDAGVYLKNTLSET